MVCLKIIKVAIIGCGPSGLTAADTLRDIDPRFDITLFERSGHVGGKCNSILPDGSILNGRTNGYDLGAVVYIKNSRSYKDAIELAEKYKLKFEHPFVNPYHSFEHVFPFLKSKQVIDATAPPSFLLYKNGKPSPLLYIPFHPKNIILNPKRFISSIYGIYKLIIHLFSYFKYSENPMDFNHFTAHSFSDIYPDSIDPVFSTFVQGFGYMDASNKDLAPALTYYYRYIQPDMVGKTFIKFSDGIQTMWYRIAESFPREDIRLNAGVSQIRRSDNKILVSSKCGEECFDYLIVATPLKRTLEFMDFSEKETELVSRMKHNHYITVMFKSEGFPAFAIGNMTNQMNSDRIGHVVFAYKPYPDSNIMNAYLYMPKGSFSDQDIIDRVEADMQSDFNTTMIEKEFAKVFHWDDYFGHLSTDDIQSGWFSTFDSMLQNKHRTLFVSSGLHMETVGASISYSKKMVSDIAPKWLTI
jgi:oxygen-dependent protoporphyrinogen oxidase